MKLNLKKPLAIFDLETTGINVANDRIVEIAIVKIMPDGQVHTKPSSADPAEKFLINPEMPIPNESSMVHGIYDEDVKDAPTFIEAAPALYKFLHDCDLGGFNSNRFDIPLIAEEFLRAGIEFNLDDRKLVDVQVIFHMMEQRTLKAGYKFYCGKSLDDAHAALPDAMATYDILCAMLDKYEDVEIENDKGELFKPVVNDMDALHTLSQRNRNADLLGRLVFNEDDVVVFNFGKYKGQSVKDVLAKDSGYYGWMMSGDFPLYTKKVLKDIKNAIKTAG